MEDTLPDLEDRFGWLGRPAPMRIRHERQGASVWVTVAITKDHYVEGPSTIVQDTEERARLELQSVSEPIVWWDQVIASGGGMGTFRIPWEPGDVLHENLIELRCHTKGIKPR